MIFFHIMLPQRENLEIKKWFVKGGTGVIFSVYLLLLQEAMWVFTYYCCKRQEGVYLLLL